MDFLKRSMAPITDAAWEAVKNEATRSLKTNLSARKIVDVAGPKGLDFAAVGLGRLDVANCDAPDNLCFGIHRTLPLVEVRVSFELDIWEMDNIERGAKDIDYSPVMDAAKTIAGFEETAVYKGFSRAGIVGLNDATRNSPFTIGLDVSTYPDVVAQGILTLRNREIGGPYALVLGPKPFQALQGSYAAYPPRKNIEQILEGPVVNSSYIDGGFLVSTRGGDMELTLGQDFSLGYETHNTKEVRLYLMESFTFRVLETAAIVKFDYTG